MSNLDQIISRYLDGDLSDSELENLHRTLAESAEARSLLREMTLIAQAARANALRCELPIIVELELFQRLRAEGYSDGRRISNHTSSTNILQWKVIRRSALVMVLLLMILGSIDWFEQPNVKLPSIAGVASLSSGQEVVNAGVMVALPEIILKAEVAQSSYQQVIFREDSERNNDQLEPASGMLSVQTPDTSSNPSVLPMTFEAIVENIPLEPQSILLPLIRSSDPGVLSASFRPGVAAVVDRNSLAMAEDMNIHINARFGGGHRVSLIAGRGPEVIETRREGTDIFISRPARQSTNGHDDATSGQNLEPVRPFDLELKQEVWMGVGYGYSFATPSRNVQIGVSGSVGSSASAWRMSADLPVSLRLSNDVSIEGVPSVSYLLPRDRSVREFSIDTSPDGLLYLGRIGRPAFTMVGLQVGVRVDL